MDPTTLRVRIDPANTAVQDVSLFADGQVVCTLQRPPYECSWDAGAALREHVLRATATLPDGTRLVTNLRTRGAGYVEQVDVDAVQVTVTVTDADGKLVRRLPRDAFRVREDGAPQAVTAFANDNIPLEIVVALDVSYSMTDAMPSLKAAARTFLGALRPADQVTLLAFNDNIFTLARQSTDMGQRVRAVERLAPWGGTALYDVILTSMNLLGRQAGRRSLVVFTDGEDQSSVATLKRVETRMETSDATIYAIGLGRGVRETGLRAILERARRRERRTRLPHRANRPAPGGFWRYSRGALEPVPAGLRAHECGARRGVAANRRRCGRWQVPRARAAGIPGGRPTAVKGIVCVPVVCSWRPSWSSCRRHSLRPRTRLCRINRPSVPPPSAS